MENLLNKNTDSPAKESLMQSGKTEFLLSSPPVIISGSLDPYSGPWTEDTAKHLLFRTVYGPTKHDIEEVQELG